MTHNSKRFSQFSRFDVTSSYSSSLCCLPGHPWICKDGVAPDQALDPAVLSRLKQFSVMNKLKKMALMVSRLFFFLSCRIISRQLCWYIRICSHSYSFVQTFLLFSHMAAWLILNCNKFYVDRMIEVQVSLSQVLLSGHQCQCNVWFHRNQCCERSMNLQNKIYFGLRFLVPWTFILMARYFKDCWCYMEEAVQMTKWETIYLFSI